MKNVVTSLKKLKIVLSVLTVCKVLLKMSRDFRCEGSGHDAKLQKHYIRESYCLRKHVVYQHYQTLRGSAPIVVII